MANPTPAPRLRLGSTAPNFKADTTAGPIDFHEYIGDGWVVFFSHPEDYTPVCTTELGAFAALEPEFSKRGVKLIGLSANTVDSHKGWVGDIKDFSGNNVGFPIIADKQRQVAYLYDMLDYQDTTNVDEKGIVSCRGLIKNAPQNLLTRLRGLHHPVRLRHRPQEDDPPDPLVPGLDGPQLGRGAARRRLAADGRQVQGDDADRLGARPGRHRAPVGQDGRGQEDLARDAHREAVPAVHAVGQGESHRGVRETNRPGAG